MAPKVSSNSGLLSDNFLQHVSRENHKLNQDSLSYVAQISDLEEQLCMLKKQKNGHWRSEDIYFISWYKRFWKSWKIQCLWWQDLCSSKQSWVLFSSTICLKQSVKLIYLDYPLLLSLHKSFMAEWREVTLLFNQPSFYDLSNVIFLKERLCNKWWMNLSNKFPILQDLLFVWSICMDWGWSW